MIETLLCKKNQTLLAALKQMNLNAKGRVFVVDDLHRLCGVLTDGDIRRALMNGYHLDEKIEGIIHSDFVYAKQNEPYEGIIKKMNEKISVIPIVDNDFKVIDYFECRLNMHIPIASPNLGEKEFKYLIDAFLSTWISSNGQYIESFEKQFAHFCETAYGVATSNGTVALHLALKTLNVGAGDEVIVPDLTFAAPINTVFHAGATPVIVDVEPESWCIDPQKIQKAITSKTKAIIPVHLYGQPCNMRAIMEIARKHDLFVIEDCAEAHGAKYDGKKVGSFGHIGCFSFFANKIITTGEGGMCVTSDEKLNERLRILRDHGMNKTKKYWHEEIGYNYRLTNLQAAIGLAQLERIDSILKTRQSLEGEYVSGLSDLRDIEFQKHNLPLREKVVWLMNILVPPDQRDPYLHRLNREGIDARPFFYSLSQMDLYKKYVVSNHNSLDLSSRGISLPINNQIDDQIIQKIRGAIS